jgi:hypothetical protein
MPRARARGGVPADVGESASNRDVTVARVDARAHEARERATRTRRRGDRARASRGGARNARVGDKDGAIRDAADDFERGGGARRAREDELGRASVDEDERVVDASRDGRR